MKRIIIVLGLVMVVADPWKAWQMSQPLSGRTGETTDSHELQRIEPLETAKTVLCERAVEHQPLEIGQAPQGRQIGVTQGDPLYLQGLEVPQRREVQRDLVDRGATLGKYAAQSTGSPGMRH